MNRQPLGNEVYLEEGTAKVFELGDVRRKWKDKPIMVDEILDFHQLKTVTVSTFGKPAGWEETI